VVLKGVFDEDWIEDFALMTFLISNFRRVLNVVLFLLGESLVYEFYVPTFRNTVPSS